MTNPNPEDGSFLTEPEPTRGFAVQILSGVRRIVARNPGVMTYLGTNTYLVMGNDGLTVVDPGPQDAKHIDDILAAAIRSAHPPHPTDPHPFRSFWCRSDIAGSDGALTSSYHQSAKPAYTPDKGLNDGDQFAGFTAIHTPGHAMDHLCFAYDLPEIGTVLFSGDHVMSWSSSIVSPPDGDMLAYYRSLELLLRRRESLYLPGHGPALPNPQGLVRQLLAHRQAREMSILNALKLRSWTIGELSALLYVKFDLRLKVAAERNVLAHLLKLEHEGLVISQTPNSGQGNAKDTDIQLHNQDAQKQFWLKSTLE